MEAASKEALAVKADSRQADKFIEAHRGFIISCVSKQTRRFVTEQDDTYAIGLEAFHEAIEAYEEGKGDFLPFAALVIRRRLVDESRKMGREIPVSMTETGGEDEETPFGVELQASEKMNELSREQSRQRDDAEAVLEEIAEAQKLLAGYGFSFFDLTTCSPKSKRTKETCRSAIVRLLRPGELYEKMKRTGQLPMKELAEATGLPKKKLERHRKYIMAVAELLRGDFPHLQEYLTDIRKELET